MCSLPETLSSRGCKLTTVQIGSNEDLTILRRFWNQSPIWMEHFWSFKVAYGVVSVCFIVGICFFVVALLTPEKQLIFHGFVMASIYIGFLVFWLMTPKGPPFLCTKDGILLKPSYSLSRS
ncbi:UNVERIFIED_CONTAM: hypothetical protein NCL1_37935 [Trichonephila clavipes]